MNLFKILLSGLFIISINMASAQTIKTYESQWKKVDDFVAQRLPKSALEEVQKIYAAARNEKQEAQVIKSLVYISSLQQPTRENNEIESIHEMEKELSNHSETAKSILKSFLAQLYWNYYQRHRYQLYNRTNTANFDKQDIATWTTEDFHKRISDLFLGSLQNKKLLQQTSLASYKALIQEGNVRYLRPTLYDLLAHHALTYFENNERDIRKPAYAFEINEPKAFAPATQFAKAEFNTADSSSLQYQALLNYQEIIRFHLNDTKPDALIDADIDRIQFVKDNAVLPRKEELYQQALTQIIKTYNKNPAAIQATYLLAAYYENSATQYQPLQDTTHRYDRVKAKELLEALVKDSSVKNEGWANAYNLLQEINKKTFSFSTEKVNIPDQPFRSLVTYKNVGTLYFRLLNAATLKTSFSYDNADVFWSQLTSTAPVKAWQQTLPDTHDFQEHAAEIKIEALPIGDYILVGSADPKFNGKKSLLEAQYFSVSNISYLTKENHFFVLHRTTGQPLYNATVALYQQQVDPKTSSYVEKKMEDVKTDKNGYFKIDKIPNENNLRSALIVRNISYGNDHLDIREEGYQYYRNNEQQKKDTALLKVFFFTDRSIYRPGQTIYFKGIAVSAKRNENNLATGYKTTIHLFNVNSEIVDSIEVTANEYGSFSGRFTLPQNALNGLFEISDKDQKGTTSFSVEEYKRPKFYVEFQKITGSYKVLDSIAVDGNAKAYAGNKVDGAKVVYRVVRQPRLFYPWLYGRWFPPVQPMEMAHGETITGKDGNFTIHFKAIPDLTIEQKWDPVFDYVIYADVTDINGETRSGEQTVRAGYKSLLLKVALEDRMPIDSLKNISIRTENMSGAFQASSVMITFYTLKPENRLIRKRYWQQPDQYVMSKEEFLQAFPHDEYYNETDFKTWERGNKAAEIIDSSNENSTFNLKGAKLEAGFYSVQITTLDKDGAEVKDIRYVELFNAQSKTLSRPEYLWARGEDHPVEPGEKALLQIGSGLNEVFLIQNLSRGSELRAENTFSFSTLNKEKKDIEFTATEQDRGGYGVTLFFVRDNRVYQFQQIIQIPWSNKDLKVEYATFRDKTLPGSEERWKIKISGLKGERVGAEMLASMYDASLDQFKIHNWTKPDVWPVFQWLDSWQTGNNFSTAEPQFNYGAFTDAAYKYFEKKYDDLTFGLKNSIGYEEAPFRGNVFSEMAAPLSRNLSGRASGIAIKQAGDIALKVAKDEESEVDDSTTNVTAPNTFDNTGVQIRKNFNETAFFFPDLRTDENGAIEFSFTVPEALTRWKLQAFAHTKDLAFGLSQKEIITQKELMVQPNAPRFLRQGDRVELSAKIVNLSDKELTGQAELQLFDATTNQPVDGWFQNMYANQYFTVAAGQSEAVKFPVEVPYLFNSALVWRIVAKAQNFSDGEEAALPVLTNKLLVTETLPLPMNGTGTKKFTFEKLLHAGNNESLQQHSLTVEYTSNPAWYAVQALPYLMEYPYECAEQNWNRYYANSLATMIVNASPRIKQIFEQWKTKDTGALLSNLQKNETLKSALLQETPWVLQAKTEAQQKKNIALLFDLVRMSNELKANLEKLKGMQNRNGSFVWFKGGPDDRYITQYILTGIGHLKKLGAIPAAQQNDLQELVNTALTYLDKKLAEDYTHLLKDKADLKKQHIGYLQVQYLYMRSFFKEQPFAKETETAYNYFRHQAQQFWTSGNPYMQGMTALALNRTGDAQTPVSILKSLKETSIYNEELGMYWKNMGFGYSWQWWYAPIETESLLIEAFSEIAKDTKTADALRTWLLKNKQTNYWHTTKATADACYALLLQGTNWLTNEPVVTIQLGDRSVSSKENNMETGTGYFKQTIDGNFIKPEMGNISVAVSNIVNGKPAATNASWGAVYWQYFEDMDKVTSAATPLQLNKKLFIQTNNDRGPVLTPVGNENTLHVGDRVKVRMELRVDRDMEYVHLKDMRASSLEPVNVLSGYKWQSGLGYYESTGDASTNFFFTYLPKGTYVFEYPLFVTHTGNFSNGISTIQCMYAPEFSAHSEGVRINVE